MRLARLQMNRGTSTTRDAAQRLIARAIEATETPHKPGHEGFESCDKMRTSLVTLMGQTGFQALLSRALSLAQAEVAWLKVVRVKPGGSLEGWETPSQQLSPEKWREGRVALLAELIGLLIAFIGKNLTVRLLSEVWPKAPLNHLDFGEGGKNDKAK